MRTTINCRSQERRGSFLHLALLRSLEHRFNHTEFNARKGSELQQTLSTVSDSFVDPFYQSRRHEALTVEAQRVGPWEITHPIEGNTQFGPGSQYQGTQPEFLISENKGYAPVRILGAQPRDGLLWIEARQRQNSTVDRTGIGFLTASRRLLRGQAHSYGRTYRDNKDSRTLECSISGQPLVLRRTMTAGLEDLKTETFYYGKRCVIGVEEKRSSLSGELICSAPKSLEKISKRKIVWTEMSKLCLSSGQNRMKSRSRLDGSLSGFILNLVNGGYAVALAGYIAFLPKSLCMTKKVFIGQWRQFAIISMNPKIANIVVKEIRPSLTTPVMGTARVQKKRRRRISPS